MDTVTRDELIKKYQWAGRIRRISSVVLFLFVASMQLGGGYTYLGIPFIILILTEAIANQPHRFLLAHINLYRFQFYQMLTDIIAISWILYYMGGIEAPVVSIAYYAVILWAGVVSGVRAVLFSVITAAAFFAAIVILTWCGILPPTGHFTSKLPAAQMLSILFGNVAFLFAFGYFSAHSSRVVKSLERERQEESLRHVHKLLATGYLVGGTVHDTLNHLATIKGNAQLLALIPANTAGETAERLHAIEEADAKAIELLHRLARFSRPIAQFAPTDINQTIEEALQLIWPAVRYTRLALQKRLAPDLPPVMAHKDELQEVFVALALNAVDAIAEREGALAITTACRDRDRTIEITFADTGKGIRPDDLKRIGEPFFSTKEAGKGAGVGLATSYTIISRHHGTITAQSSADKGAIFTIRLPAADTPAGSHRSVPHTADGA